jgi:hypothetical protein
VIRRLQRFAATTLGLAAYLRAPGDGRCRPTVPAADVIWAVLVSYLIRDGAFHAVESLVHSRARRAAGIRTAFGDDTVAYVTERLAVAPTRAALATAITRTKRHKAFDDTLAIGLVLDGTTAGRCPTATCRWCHLLGAGGTQHKLSLLSVVGGGLVLPLDVEPYGPGDSEQAASLRLLQRGVTALGRRFAQYVVADGLYASAPFLHAAGDLGLHALVRLKDNVPTLATAVAARFADGPPTTRFVDAHGATVEMWDAADFDPWEGLRWATVRVLRYRQTRPTGEVIEADWLTDLPASRVSARTLYRFAKTRWTIENQGFNDAKNRYGLAHVPHHHANSLLVHWLLVALTLTIERLYRLRYLHRGRHPRLTAIALVRRLRLSLGLPVSALDTG